MLLKRITYLLGTTSLIRGAQTHSLVPRQDRGGKSQSSQNTCLNDNALQTASTLTGQEPGTEGIKEGQAPSATDPANFINFCSGETLTDGQQITSGSCNGIPMGKIPATSNMISAIITNPKPGDVLPENEPFDIVVQTIHLNAGNFVNPTTNYYTAPQDLDEKGDIIGHCHVTVQSLGDSLRTTTPPDPQQFGFFKGIDDAGNGQGLLKATVTDGLEAGFYRVCTLISAQNHQAVNMPVAQRGAQDDCTKFEVKAAGGAGKGKGGKQKGGNANVGGDTGKVVSKGKGKAAGVGKAAGRPPGVGKAPGAGKAPGVGKAPAKGKKSPGARRARRSFRL